MKILHTSDWHLGRTLHSNKKERYDEHRAFFEWLLETIEKKAINVLLIAGDIFDNATPGSSSQKLYYDFLIRVRTAGCEHVIVVGGNHDSPSFLNAPKDILAALNVVVIGNSNENIADEIFVIKDKKEKPLCIVCAVPFLRERDISRFEDGESYSNRSKRLNETIKKHYAEIAQLAENKRKELGVTIPIIATGHLSVAGGKRDENDGVRDIYIGNIEAVGSDIFPKTFDYVALGHYHIPSIIKDHIRYCGSPIPMGFGEANQNKSVYVIDFTDKIKIETINIPVFQKLETVVGDKKRIEQRLSELKRSGSSVWIEVFYTGDEIFPNLSAWTNEQIADSNIEVLKVQNRQHLNELLNANDTSDALEELDTFDVFDKLLEKASISNPEKEELMDVYKEIVDSLNTNE